MIASRLLRLGLAGPVVGNKFLISQLFYWHIVIIQDLNYQMNITLKSKAAEKEVLLRKAMNIKIIAGAVSKQIKDCLEPPQIPSKNITHGLSGMKGRKMERENPKQSLETTASSFSTQHQSAQKYRRAGIQNPELQSILKQHLECLSNKGNSYTIKWRNPTSGISKSMRVILGEWLMQLSHELDLPRDVVYNAMHYTDKFVGLVTVGRSKYQSIGLCALFIASKLELSNHPNIDTFVEAMDGAITKSELIALEQNMVVKLRFRLNPPTLCQYMILLVSLFNHFVARTNCAIPAIVAGTPLYEEVFWMLDGVHLDNQYKQFQNKEKICLSILYISVKKSRWGKTSACLQKLHSELETLKQGETEKMFDCFLSSAIQIYRKLNDIKDCIAYYRKWVWHQRVLAPTERQIQQLKKIVMGIDPRDGFI